jgi:hypothetical protein
MYVKINRRLNNFLIIYCNYKLSSAAARRSISFSSMLRLLYPF